MGSEALVIWELFLKKRIKIINVSLGNRAVMVNFLCQLGWVLVPRYLVKHDSGCFCEGGFYFFG